MTFELLLLGDFEPLQLSTTENNRVFPKVDHSDARIVLEQNKFSKKKTTSNRS